MASRIVMAGFSKSRERERWMKITRTSMRIRDLSGTTLLYGSNQDKGCTGSTEKLVQASPP